MHDLPYSIDDYSNHNLNVLFFEFTSKCNANCVFCGSNCKSESEIGLPCKEFCKVLDDVKENYGTKGIMINITGGEPLIRKDLFEFTAYASKLGFRWGLVTNGMLINDNIIRKMRDTHMSTISISIDGLKETHEALRRVPGCFDKIISNIMKLKEANFIEHIQVTCTLSKANLKDLYSLYRLLSMLGIDSMRIGAIDPIGRANETQELLLEKQDFEYIFQFIKYTKEFGSLPIEWTCSHYLGNTSNDYDVTNRKFACYTGIHVASILSNGDIFVCPNVPRNKDLIQGNILKDSFVDVWENKFELFRKKGRLKSKKCKNCSHYNDCQGDSFHTFDFKKQEQRFCFKDIFPNGIETVNTNKNITPISVDEILQNVKKDCNRKITYESHTPKNSFSKAVIFEPEAIEQLENIFLFGKRHPLNLYEQQVALAGFLLNNDTYLIRYVFSSILLNRSNNMAISDEFCLQHTLDEVHIINENLPYSNHNSKTNYGKVEFLGYAHSHPDKLGLGLSEVDKENLQSISNRFPNFLSIIVDPQNSKMIGFTKSLEATKIIILR